MAQYSNPELPEDVNNSDAAPILNFVVLAGSAVLIGVIVTAVLAVFGGAFARYVPYTAEVRVIQPYAALYPPREHVVEAYLQGIADKLIRAGGMALPEGMSVRVHYVDEPAVNAFATLGGHVAVYRGLAERMRDENMLAMVIAHEIAHAKHRHPIVSLGRAVAFGAALSVVSSGAGSSVADSLLGQSGMLTLFSFNRAQEEEADGTGVAALARAYGHAGGATDTFRVLEEASAEPGRVEPPEFVNTHPMTQGRMVRLTGIITSNGWKAQGVRSPIPAAVSAFMAKESKR